jgi:hypothetical protein
VQNCFLVVFGAVRDLLLSAKHLFLAAAAALSAAGPGANSHRVCPRFLPLFGQLRCESVCVRPSAGRHAGQGF